MVSPIERFRENLRDSTGIKLEPDMWFSPGLAAFVRHVALYEQLHPDAMSICLLNRAVQLTLMSAHMSLSERFSLTLG